MTTSTHTNRLGGRYAKTKVGRMKLNEEQKMRSESRHTVESQYGEPTPGSAAYMYKRSVHESPLTRYIEQHNFATGHVWQGVTILLQERLLHFRGKLLDKLLGTTDGCLRAGKLESASFNVWLKDQRLHFLKL